MKIKGLVEEDFVNYKLPSMYIIFPNCSFKCDKENGNQYCQNWSLSKEPCIDIPKEEILNKYIKNPITEAIVLGGLEPFDSEYDLLPFIDCARRQFKILDPIIIYTGYTEEELTSGNFGTIQQTGIQQNYWKILLSYGNIIIKFGRFKPNQEKHYDSLLGIYLASNNQYAKEYK